MYSEQGRYDPYKKMLSEAKQRKDTSGDRAAVLSGIAAAVFVFYTYIMLTNVDTKWLILTLITTLLAAILAIFQDLRCLGLDLKGTQRQLGLFILGLAILALLITFGYMFTADPEGLDVYNQNGYTPLLVPAGAIIAWFSVRNFAKSRIVSG